MEENLQVENSIFISEKEKEYLLETSRWGMFLAIVGYVGLGLMLLFSLFMTTIFSAFDEFSSTPFPFPVGAFGLIYVIIAVLYFFPVYYLHQFSRKIKKGLTFEDQTSITLGFRNLKSLFKFMGIFTIIILSLYILFIAGMMIFGAFFASSLLQ